LQVILNMHIQCLLNVNDRIHKEVIEYDVIQSIYSIPHYPIFLENKIPYLFNSKIIRYLLVSKLVRIFVKLIVDEH
jgi:hypothetical protein